MTAVFFIVLFIFSLNHLLYSSVKFDKDFIILNNRLYFERKIPAELISEEKIDVK